MILLDEHYLKVEKYEVRSQGYNHIRSTDQATVVSYSLKTFSRHRSSYLRDKYSTSPTNLDRSFVSLRSNDSCLDLLDTNSFRSQYLLRT